jgi:N-acetylneuraminate synthase
MSPRPRIRVGNRWLGDGEPVYIIAEIGINHNGSLDLAEKMIAGAARAGCDAVKFQKRTPELCVPRGQWDKMRETPWGPMTYIEYRRRIEFGLEDYEAIDRICRRLGIDWFASCWDEPSVDFVARFDPPLFKGASASLTDLPLLTKMRATSRPLMISTGMSTLAEMDAAVTALGEDGLLIAHSTSAYPCPLENLNLRVIPSIRGRYRRAVIGYSGHEPGLAPTGAAVALGARFIERHITLDRALWGSDQAASVEIHGLEILVRNIRDIESALGDGVKRVYESELAARTRLRRVQGDIPLPVSTGLGILTISDNN